MYCGSDKDNDIGTTALLVILSGSKFKAVFGFSMYLSMMTWSATSMHPSLRCTFFTENKGFIGVMMLTSVYQFLSHLWIIHNNIQHQICIFYLLDWGVGLRILMLTSIQQPCIAVHKKWNCWPEWDSAYQYLSEILCQTCSTSWQWDSFYCNRSIITEN